MLLFVAAVACNKESSDQKPDPVPVAFQVSLDRYATKATDTAFESGDSLALWATGAVAADCVPLVCNGSTFATPSVLYWSDLSSASASFSAIFPFAAGRSSVFTVAADQSSHAAYTASDLMIGSCTAEHGATVSLPMKHQLCQLAVCIKNEIDDPVAEVWVKGVKTSVGCSRTGIGAVSGDAVSVKACAATLPDGTSAYVAIVPPQEFDCSVVVVTAGGTQFKYSTGAFRVDESGVQVRFELVLNALSLSCAPEPFVTGWTMPLVQDSSSIGALSLSGFKGLPAEDTGMYKISGKIVAGASDAFFLTDAADTVAVGALLSPSCVPGEFAAKGLCEGDFLRVYGARAVADGVATMPAAVYVSHAAGLAVAPAAGETFVWSGVADLADWSSELRVPASAFAAVTPGSKLRIHLCAVFNNFWSLKLYSGTMDPILPGASDADGTISGTAAEPVLELEVAESVAALLKASGLVVRGTAVLGALGL